MNSRYKNNKRLRKLEQFAIKKSRYRRIMVFFFVIFIILLIWGKFCEPNILLIHDYKLESETLPRSFDGTRIVHFSDLHYGNLNEHQLNKTINNINSLKPDIVVFTGDLVEEGFELKDNDIKVLVKYLSKINSKFGKYAIQGNHDVKNDNFDNIMYDSHFTVLKNNYDTIYNENNDSILLYGTDDLLHGEPQIKGFKSKEIDNISYKIILIHEPDYIDDFIHDYNVSLVLAGHSHGKQVNIPLLSRLFLPKGSRKYYESYYEINNTPFYISNGVGNSVINYRLFTPPSINIYRLYSK